MREEGVVTFHLPSGPRDVNPEHTSPLGDDLSTARLEPVHWYKFWCEPTFMSKSTTTKKGGGGREGKEGGILVDTNTAKLYYVALR